MAILDLQGLEAPSEQRGGNSGSSKGCGARSSFSLLLR
jgi:hypothetical protein